MKFKHFILLQVALIVMACALSAHAARVKDIANVRGVRDNQLIGYGIVVGLKGTGDSKNEFTNKSMARMLDKLGMKLDEKEVASKNVAAVILTATLPPFARAGNKLDLTANSIGDASSLSGGTLLQAPLRAADQQIYAVAQGALLVGSGADSHSTVGRLPNGAIIERDVAEDFTSRKMFRLTLHNPDFTTAARLAKKINLDLSGKYATAKDAGTVDIVVPFAYEGKAVELLASIEALEVTPDARARVLDTGTSVGDLVKAMNSLGVSPKDLITILQNIKAAGALQGELEIL
jgi:flagellar P-ring protein precursor FlgI